MAVRKRQKQHCRRSPGLFARPEIDDKNDWYNKALSIYYRKELSLNDTIIINIKKFLGGETNESSAMV
ncbi:hypothetical protein PspKH34_36920 [Parageobacillus sp. KH3-4]|uniref:Uncharacterized protein n=1 Tax=Parageobacillus thermoglucosidasius TaxID=1426 RepID=A0A1B7KNQ8_PARTM|nr:hypothetical protein A7K69_13045 [Parageobacillus thermoglucosidasius]BDG49131.1 hypothetical protein PspKH34_36920 [Parageobacillus sp. KH3-4]